MKAWLANSLWAGGEPAPVTSGRDATLGVRGAGVTIVRASLPVHFENAAFDPEWVEKRPLADGPPPQRAGRA